jgi:hypothetical protein
MGKFFTVNPIIDEFDKRTLHLEAVVEHARGCFLTHFTEAKTLNSQIAKRPGAFWPPNWHISKTDSQ